MTDANKTNEWYRNYYVRKGPDRNDLLRSPEVLLQSAASDMALVRALGRIGYRPLSQRILDIGGATGGCLVPFMQVGAHPDLLTCVDIRPEAIEEGKRRFPGVDFLCADASAIPLPSSSFDIVYSSTMFVTLPDDVLAKAIAAEMVRVTKPGQILLIRDWLFPKPGDRHYSALTRTRLKRLFPDVEVLFMEKGSLVPPVGRFLSAHLPSMYFFVRACLPFLTGLGVYALRKPA